MEGIEFLAVKLLLVAMLKTIASSMGQLRQVLQLDKQICLAGTSSRVNTSLPFLPWKQFLQQCHMRIIIQGQSEYAMPKRNTKNMS